MKPSPPCLLQEQSRKVCWPAFLSDGRWWAPRWRHGPFGVRTSQRRPTATVCIANHTSPCLLSTNWQCSTYRQDVQIALSQLTLIVLLYLKQKKD